MDKYDFTEAIDTIENYWQATFQDYRMTDQSVVQQAFYGGQQTAYSMIMTHLKNVHDTQKK